MKAIVEMKKFSVFSFLKSFFFVSTAFCISASAQVTKEFQNEFDFEAYKTMVLTEAGLTKTDLFADAPKGFEEFQETPAFKEFVAAISKHPIPTEGMQEKINAC